MRLLSCSRMSCWVNWNCRDYINGINELWLPDASALIKTAWWAKWTQADKRTGSILRAYRLLTKKTLPLFSTGVHCISNAVISGRCCYRTTTLYHLYSAENEINLDYEKLCIYYLWSDSLYHPSLMVLCQVHKIANALVSLFLWTCHFCHALSLFLSSF